MIHQTTLVYNERLLRQAVLKFWWRTVGVGFFIALGVVAGSFGLLLSRGYRSWLVGVLATVLLFGVAFVVLIYFVHYRSSIRKFKAMGSPEATLTASESSLSFSSGAGSSTFPWSAISEIWRFPDLWLVLFSKAQFTTLPLANMAPELRAFVLERVRASGGRVG